MSGPVNTDIYDFPSDVDVPSPAQIAHRFSERVGEECLPDPPLWRPREGGKSLSILSCFAFNIGFVLTWQEGQDNIQIEYETFEVSYYAYCHLRAAMRDLGAITSLTYVPDQLLAKRWRELTFWERFRFSKKMRSISLGERISLPIFLLFIVPVLGIMALRKRWRGRPRREP
jgi:hypothetical protein